MGLHNASVVLLGATRSNLKTVSCEAQDPTNFPAGLVVRRTTANGLVVADNSTAAIIGVSLGADLSSTKKTAVCREGKSVPVRIAAALVKGSLTFTAKSAASDITIAFLDTGSAGAEVVTVTEHAISVSMEDGVSTATQLKAALDGTAAALALISTAIAGGAGATAQAAFAVDGIDDFSFVAIGGRMEVSPTTGHAVADGDATAGVYVSGALDGIDPTTGDVVAKVVLVDMPGGL